MTDRPIEDYALLSDAHSAALVARDGSVDWATFPRFDSPAVFARLLGRSAGSWRIAPCPSDDDQHPVATSRRYLDGTMVLETTFETDGGTLTVTDAMPFADTEDPHDLGTAAPHALLRRVACTRGRVAVEHHYEPRPEYGLMVPILREVEGGIFHLGGSWSLVLSSSMPLRLLEGDAVAAASFELEEGDEAWLALRWVRGVDGAPQTWDVETMRHWLDATIAEWRSWSAEHQRYQGPWADLVHHSGRLLQSLTYWPTGAIIAAPTTSLPESPGGERNWDYRYCWVRDTSMTIEALRVAACPIAADRFLDWIVRTAGGDLRAGQDLQIMYGVGGEHALGEWPLPHLEGWRGSRPVRVGNGAWSQRQLDVYGELIAALYATREHLQELDDIELGFLRDLANSVMTRWQEPDQGMWEIRAEPRHHVHSKLMCWVALDRAIRLVDDLNAHDRLDAWRDGRDAIREAILEQGWSERIGAFTQSFHGDSLDAAVLTMAIQGFLPADDERMLSTMDVIERDLTDDHGLVYRYRGASDGLSGEEGAFALCTFWLAQCRAMAGQVDEAIEVFERVACRVNDVGLLAEQVTGSEMLGNFPQAFSHIGLVNAAQAIARAQRGQARSDAPLPPPKRR